MDVTARAQNKAQSMSAATCFYNYAPNMNLNTIFYMMSVVSADVAQLRLSVAMTESNLIPSVPLTMNRH